MEPPPPSLPYLIVQILAGLGLFFVGLKMLGGQLKNLAGPRFKALLGKLGANPLLAAFWGTLAGLVTQSGRTTSFILASIVQGGLLDIRKALPIVIWSNLGCTLIVFAAVLPLDLIIPALVGVFGICLAFELPQRYRNSYGAFFGVALMLFGLAMISDSAKGFQSYEWFQTLLSAIRFSHFLGFLIGLVLTIIVQSHMAVILIALAMTKSGLFSFDQAVMIVFGTQAGSSAITYALSVNFKGTPLQLVIMQVVYNLVGVVLFVTLFYVGFFGGFHLFQPIAALFSSSVDGQVATVAILFNLVTPAIVHALRDPLFQGIQRFFPPDEREHLAKPGYIREELRDNPETALLLVEKEQLRLLRRLPLVLGRIRSRLQDAPTPHGLDDDPENAANATPEVLHDAHREVTARVRVFLADLLHQHLPIEMSEYLLNLQNRLELLTAIEESVYTLYADLCPENGAALPDGVSDLGLRVTEAIDTQLLTCIEVLETNDGAELDLLLTITADRGDVMENIRKSYFVAGTQPDPALRNQVLNLTNLFERVTWSVGRFSRLLQQSQDASGA